MTPARAIVISYSAVTQNVEVEPALRNMVPPAFFWDRDVCQKVSYLGPPPPLGVGMTQVPKGVN